MIIHDIRVRKPLFGIFGNTHLIIETDEGTGKTPITWNDPALLAQITNALQSQTITTSTDLEKLPTLLPHLPTPVRQNIELALLNATPQPWTLFGKTTKQIPRPLSVIARTNDGTEFLLFAPNATNIVHTLLAYEAVATTLRAAHAPIAPKNTIITLHEDPATILTFIENAITTTAPRYGIDIKKGISYTTPTTPEAIRTLIDTHDLLYVETPFTLHDENAYHTLTTDYQNRCFITTRTPDLYTTGKTNAVLLTYDTATILARTTDTHRAANRHNLFLNGQPGIISLASSLSIPVIKFPLQTKIGAHLTKELLVMHHTLKTHIHKPKGL